MVGKEQWRRHAKGLDIEGFPQAWIGRGLREIHHVGDQMDGRMDACLGYTAVLSAEIYKLIGELKDELREDCHNFHLFTYFLSKFEAPKHSFKS